MIVKILKCFFQQNVQCQNIAIVNLKYIHQVYLIYCSIFVNGLMVLNFIEQENVFISIKF